MKSIKYLFLFVLSFALFSCALAQENRTTNKNAVKKAEEKNMNTEVTPCEPDLVLPGDEIKTLAEGSYGRMETPFLFIARDAKTYAHLQNMIENLPPASEINFGKQAVAAAFAGTKPTGGYSVEIKKSGAGVSIEVSAPPPDAIVTEALTMPYKVVLVPLEEETALALEVSENWKQAAETFKISSGDFKYSGGLVAREKKFPVEGTIEVYRFENLVTLRFNLSGKGEDKEMKLSETASGTAKNGQIDLARLDAGSFSENPKPPLKVSGRVTGDKLVLTFEPLPTNVADGFEARGKIEAIKGT